MTTTVTYLPTGVDTVAHMSQCHSAPLPNISQHCDEDTEEAEQVTIELLPTCPPPNLSGHQMACFQKSTTFEQDEEAAEALRWLAFLPLLLFLCLIEKSFKT
eukprot:GFYU01000476.1.p1 GENE.GFYU01000476.1~~GFYU01000476.1.p1  ORF type:complete len:102 (+),score=24.28 GFYU01000476.1:203-508(+)